ncbi:MAG: YggS family pyridoxal phosphate-dependent enzyme [Alphaproteobacteria bacterium]|nr:YggS family pyridoxal phosphate-dependent enzyme [Alphaproteobacteria bacterium]
MNNDVCGNLIKVENEIQRISQEFNCKKLPKLIAVSKNQESEKIEHAINCGQIDFAENYIQEAEAKWVHLKKKYPAVRLHLIGNLQKNKVKKALHLFDCIHTIDSFALLKKTSQVCLAENLKNKTFLIQILLDKNSSAKHGLLPIELPDLLKQALELNLNITGLMGVASVKNSLQDFTVLAKLATQNNLSELSMGMSGDYAAAIQCGSTMLRLGTAIFGERQT